MRSLFIALLSLISITSFGQTKMVYDPDAVLREIAGDVKELVIAGSVKVYLVQGDKMSLAVSARKLENLTTTLENGVLTIASKGMVRSNNAKAYLALPSVERVNVSGASELKMEGAFKATAMSINLSGASEMTGEVETGDLTVRLSGASDAKLKGSATSLSLHSSGASDFSGLQLKSENAKVDLSGACDADIYVTGSLRVKASGASDVAYRGDAQIVSKDLSGSSELSKKL